MPIAFERRGSGEPLVLLHGIGMSGRAWNPVMDRVGPERDVIAVDVPGFGASAAELDRRRSIAEQAAVLREFFAGIGVERPHVAGNSMGGGLAFELARLGAARSVTVFSPIGFGGRLSGPWESGLLRFSYSAAKASPEQPAAWRIAASRPWSFMVGYGRPFRVSAEEIREGAVDLKGADGFLDVLPGVTGYRLRDPEQLRDTPLTIAWGRRDVLLNWRIQSRRARRALPWARHVDLPGCGHVPFSDDPESCARILRQGSAAI